MHPAEPVPPARPATEPRVLEAFPTRPLTVARTGLSSPILLLVISVAMFLGFLVTTAAAVVNLAPDLAVRAHPAVVDTATVDGSCHTKKFVTSCDATLSYQLAGRSYSVERFYMWVGPSDDTPVEVEVAADHPENATLSIGLDHLWNRVLTLGGLAILLLVVGIGVLRQWQVARATSASVRGAQRLVPAVVSLTLVRKVRAGGRMHRFILDTAGTKVTREQRLRKNEGDAFMVAPGRALAVHAEGREAYPVLLDAGLTRLDLDAEERARLVAAAPQPA